MTEDKLEGLARQGRWLLVLTGLPASGKSTFRAQILARHPHIRVVSPDDLRPVVYGQTFDPSHEPVLWQIAYTLLGHWLRRGDPTIFDATNLTRRVRRPLLEAALRHGSRAWAMYFRVPLDLALSRNASRHRMVPEDKVREMADRLEPPSVEEGFEQVVVVEPEEETP